MGRNDLLSRTLGLLTFVGLAASGGAAGAATFNVNNTSDNGTPNNGQCTLREALNAANLNIFSADCQVTGSPGWDEIKLLNGSYSIASTLTVNDAVGIAASGLNNVTFNLPNGAAGITISAGQYAEVTRVVFTGGNSAVVFIDDTAGFGLYNSLIRDRSFSAAGGQSGGILADFSSGFYMVDTTISKNINSTKGGAMFVQRDAGAYADYSTFEGNTASQFGGAVHNMGNFICFNSTFSGNRANINGSAINNGSGANSDISNCTITLSNSQNGTTGAIANDSGGTVHISNSILANQVFARNCNGTLTSLGYNLLNDLTGCTFISSTGDTTNQGASLGALASNGGPTKTHMPNAGSPAVGTAQNCAWDDQRRVLRPASNCDKGAVERP